MSVYDRGCSAISAGVDHAAVVRGGRVFAWGATEDGRCGVGAGTDYDFRGAIATAAGGGDAGGTGEGVAAGGFADGLVRPTLLLGLIDAEVGACAPKPVVVGVSLVGVAVRTRVWPTSFD